MKNENYITIQGWMINELNLSGNELILFALIYGYSQDGKSQFKGSLNYISSALRTTKRTVVRLKNKLIEKGLIIKYSDDTGDRFSVNISVIHSFLGSDKSIPLGSDKSIPLGSDKSIPNIYNNKYINNSKGKFEEISNNYLLIETIARNQKVKIETVKSYINKFIDHSDSIDTFYNNRKELFQHFGNWMRKQKLSDSNLDNEFKSFIKMFNQVSKRTYVGTDSIKELFTTAIANGFTGKQMLTAIRNMYSSSSKNKWHVDNGFVFATPEHLLKDENLNKYLNADY